MEIRIGKSAHHCHDCERAFVHEEDLYSLVRLREQAFVREDYCEACWESDRATSAYSAWSPRFYDPKVAEQEPPEVFSPLRQIFYGALETEDRNVMAMAYLAAQLLRRQKVFRLIKETDDPDGDVDVILYSDRIGNRLVEVRDPKLNYAEMDEGRRMLMERLAELENPQEEPGGNLDEPDTETADHAQSQEQPQEK